MCLDKKKNFFQKNDYNFGKCKIEAPPIITHKNLLKFKLYRTPEKLKIT